MHKRITYIVLTCVFGTFVRETARCIQPWKQNEYHMNTHVT